MSGTKSDIFFQESKRIKRERIKWISILITSNLLTFMLSLPNEDHTFTPSTPWPTDWVEVSLEVQVLAAGQLPAPVTLLDEQNTVRVAKAYLIKGPNECASFSHTQKIHLMLPPHEVAAITQNKKLKALPFSKGLSFKSDTSAPAKRRTYEISF